MSLYDANQFAYSFCLRIESISLGMLPGTV